MQKDTSKLTSQELFTQEVNKLWDRLRGRDDTIFENVGIELNPETEFEKFKSLSDGESYMKLVQENSLYEKKNIISRHFWDNIVGELYENTLNGMKEAGLLEEALASFEKSYKIEKTAELILEFGIFAEFKDKKKELVDVVMEQAFYPHSFYENTRSLIDEVALGDVLEENMVAQAINWTGDRIRDIARVTKNVYILLVYFLITPVSIISSGVGSRGADAILHAYDGRAPSGVDPSMRKFFNLVESFNPVNYIFKFLNKDLYDIANLLKKTNNLEDEAIQDIMKEMRSDPNKLIMKCWDKNKYQISTNPGEKASISDLIKGFFNGKGLANFLRNPFYNNESQLAALLKDDAADPKYQKMFYDFRVCIYEKLFEVILGYAKTVYNMDDASYEIIKAANDAHQGKNFKAFFDIKPKQENEEAMFKIMRVLVSIDNISVTLDKRKGELVADKYMDKFSDFLRQNVKQVYTELNEMANQRKYNEDRYNDDKPSDDDKAKTIQQERFDAKKSIFS